MTRTSLGIVGAGAFGSFMTQHLAPHFDVVLHDTKDVTAIAQKHGVKAGTLAEAASCAVVVIAVPVQKMEVVLRAIAPLLRPDALVVDVGSVKIKPTKLMQDILPASVSLLGTHPLFGPQSGKDGIAGLNIAVCNIRGDRGACVAQFLGETLKLRVSETTPEQHDKELAYVQGLTHLLAKVVVSLDLPKFHFTTRTYEYLEQMVEMVRYDSDELFKAIERENPFSEEAKKAFFSAARRLEEKLAKD